MDPSERLTLRRHMRQARRVLSDRDRAARAKLLAGRLARLPLFKRSRNIAFYLPNDGEIDLTPLMMRAWSMGKRCYLPVLSPMFHNRLWFAPHTPRTPLRPNRFGIPEPCLKWGEMQPVFGLDLVLAPLVAFDASGNRLGMGGGFYDRTFAYLRRHRHWRRPRLAGVAYDFQQVKRLPSANWDVPLDVVVTDVDYYAMMG